RTHLAHVHAHRVGGAAAFSVQAGQRRSGLLGGGLVDFAAAGAGVTNRQGVGIRCHFVHFDAHAIDQRDDVLDLLGLDHVVGQVIVDFRVGQVALLQALADQLFDIGLGSLTFICHTGALPLIVGLGNL